MKTLRIFISSPGDVRPERVRAYDVVQRLQTKFRAFVRLEPILWEHEPMSGWQTFQTQITPPSKTDIVVCILWARIGMRLPEDYQRPDGTRPTGSEWEFEDAYSAFQSQGTPDLYVYRKTAKPTITVESEEQLAAWQEQKRALDVFLQRWFKDHEGSFKAGFNTFESDEQFEKMFAAHLEKVIERAVESEHTGIEEDEPHITWFEGSPFLGLRAFQPEHAPIFFGRELAAREILDRFKTQAASASSGRVFLMLLGASGSGKSSLARAGVLPTLVRPGETAWDMWRHLIIRPAEAAQSLLFGLAEGLIRALPDLAHTGYGSAEKLAALLSDAPIHAIPADRRRARRPLAQRACLGRAYHAQRSLRPLRRNSRAHGTQGRRRPIRSQAARLC